MTNNNDIQKELRIKKLNLSKEVEYGVSFPVSDASLTAFSFRVLEKKINEIIGKLNSLTPKQDK